MRKGRRTRTFLLSFVGTVVVLSSLAAISLFSQPAVQRLSLPTEIPTYPAEWAKYVPSDVLQVSFRNFTLIRSLNASSVPDVPVISLIRPNVTYSTDSVLSLVTVVYQYPNQTVDMAFLSRSAYSGLAGSLAGVGGNETPIAVETETTSGIAGAWLALFPSDSMVAVAAGQSSAKEAISSTISAAEGGASPMLSRTDVRSMLYAANWTGGGLALGIQNFPGVVRTGEMTLIAVEGTRNAVQVSYVVKFPDAQTAASQVKTVKSDYITSHLFYQYGPYVEAIEYVPFSGMEGAARLVG